jgi:anti-anti-sigma factor
MISPSWPCAPSGASRRPPPPGRRPPAPPKSPADAAAPTPGGAPDSQEKATTLKPFAIECHEPQDGPAKAVDVRISGFLDAHTVVSFEKTMDELLDKGYNKMVVDLSALSYISSAGIGALMVLLQQLRRRQGDMVILQPSSKVFKILDLLGFTKIFQIHQDREEANRSLE